MKRTRLLRSSQAGFTLPELLLVLAVFVAILVVSVAHLRPVAQDSRQRDAERRLDIASILQAVNQYYTHNGSLPAAIPTKEEVIGSYTDQADICKALVPAYMKDLPLEPILGAKQVSGTCAADKQQYVTGYTIQRAADNSWVKVFSPLVENGGKVIVVEHHYS